MMFPALAGPEDVSSGLLIILFPAAKPRGIQNNKYISSQTSLPCQDGVYNTINELGAFLS